MRVECYLRQLRGDRHLAEIARQSGVNAGELSKIEHGRQFPRDEWLERLEAAYGAPRHEWYPAVVLAATESDDGAHRPAPGARLGRTDR